MADNLKSRSEKFKPVPGETFAALCVVVETRGSTPGKAGVKMRVFADGSTEGTIGGGNFEKKVIEDALVIMETGTPMLFEHHLLQEHDMCCGGSVKVYIEAEITPCQLLIFGAGHVGTELSDLAVKAGFDVSVIDDRAAYLENLASQSITRVLSNFEEFVSTRSFHGRVFAVILTYRHDIDRMLLRYILKQPVEYIGFIGSKRKVLVTRKLFLNDGIASKAELDKIDMPVGIPIGAQTPFEIAVSIVARLIERRNGVNIPKEKQIENIDLCLKK